METMTLTAIIFSVPIITALLKDHLPRWLRPILPTVLGVLLKALQALLMREIPEAAAVMDEIIIEGAVLGNAGGQARQIIVKGGIFDAIKALIKKF